MAILNPRFLHQCSCYTIVKFRLYDLCRINLMLQGEWRLLFFFNIPSRLFDKFCTRPFRCHEVKQYKTNSLCFQGIKYNSSSSHCQKYLSVQACGTFYLLKFSKIFSTQTLPFIIIIIVVVVVVITILLIIIVIIVNMMGRKGSRCPFVLGKWVLLTGK